MSLSLLSSLYTPTSAALPALPACSHLGDLAADGSLGVAGLGVRGVRSLGVRDALTLKLDVPLDGPQVQIGLVPPRWGGNLGVRAVVEGNDVEGLVRDGKHFEGERVELGLGRLGNESIGYFEESHQEGNGVLRAAALGQVRPVLVEEPYKGRHQEVRDGVRGERLGKCGQVVDCDE